jgi:aminoglycoside phosphotransferase (APT) family kinase protein
MRDAASQVLDRNATAEQVCELLKRAAVGRPIPSCSVRLVSRRRNSVLFRAEYSGAAPRPLLVKISAQFSDDTVAEARNQYAALAAISKAMGEDSRFTVPRPSPILLQSGCVVMDWVEGTSLFEQLTNWRTSPSRVLGSLRRAGEWLNRFHHSQTLEIGRIDTAKFLALVDAAFVRAKPSPVCLSAIGRARHFLDQHAERVGRVPIRRGWNHGDFKPENVMLSGDHVFGIDFEHIAQGICLSDVVNFLFHVDFRLLVPGSLHLLPFRRRAWRCFLEGYAGDTTASDLDNLAMRWFYLQRLLQAWAHDEAASRGTARLWYMRRVFRHLANNVVEAPLPG